MNARPLIAFVFLSAIFVAPAAVAQSAETAQPVECVVPSFQLLMPTPLGVGPNNISSMFSGVIAGIEGYTAASVGYVVCVDNKVRQKAAGVGQAIGNYLSK